MQRTYNARRNIISSTSHSATQPWLWISDDLLQSAYCRFARTPQCSRRHGSNVPGPLEAQRRLAKRRMGAMSIGGADWSGGLAEMFGGGAPSRFELPWQAPSKSLEQQMNRRQSQPTSGISFNNWSKRKKNQGAIVSTLLDRLATVTCLEDLRKIRTSLSPESTDLETFNDCSFATFLATTPSADNLCAYLFDPILNATDSNNITFLVKEYGSFGFAVEEVVDIVCRALYNGVVSETEMPHVASLVATLPLPAEQLVNTMTQVWMSLRTSRVVEISAETAHSFLEALNGLIDAAAAKSDHSPDDTFKRACTQLRWDLYKVLWPHRKESVIKHRQHIIRWLYTMGRPQSATADKVEMMPGHLSRLLLEMPVTERSNLTFSVTELLTRGKKHQSAVVLWLDCLRNALQGRSTSMSSEELCIWRTDLKSTEKMIVSSYSPMQIRTHLASMHPVAAVRAIATYWSPVTASKRGEQQSATFGRGALAASLSLKQLDRRLQTRASSLRLPGSDALLTDSMAGPCHTREAYVALLITSAQHTRLNTKLFQQVILLVAHLHGLRAVYSVLKALTKYGITTPPLPKDPIFESCRDTDPDLYIKLLTSPLVQPTGLTPLSSEHYVSMIEKDTMSRGGVWHRIRYHSVGAPSNSTVNSHVATDDPRSQLIHKAAETWASKHDLPCQTAFSYVYKCYRELRDKRCPIRPALSRALVAAGVLRPLQEGKWVSTMRLRRILSIVADVEGEEVADGIDRMTFEWRTRNLHAPTHLGARSKADVVSPSASVEWTPQVYKSAEELQKEKDLRYTQFVRARNLRHRGSQRGATPLRFH